MGLNKSKMKKVFNYEKARGSIADNKADVRRRMAKLGIHMRSDGLKGTLIDRTQRTPMADDEIERRLRKQERQKKIKKQ